MASLEKQIQQPWWTFGGGTVLKLGIGHRQSKDIDLFVPDPKYLGYLNPRLSDAAEQITRKACGAACCCMRTPKSPECETGRSNLAPVA